MRVHRRQFNKMFGQSPPKGGDNSRDKEKSRCVERILHISFKRKGERLSAQFWWWEPNLHATSEIEGMWWLVPRLVLPSRVIRMKRSAVEVVPGGDVTVHVFLDKEEVAWERREDSGEKVLARELSVPWAHPYSSRETISTFFDHYQPWNVDNREMAVELYLQGPNLLQHSV